MFEHFLEGHGFLVSEISLCCASQIIERLGSVLIFAVTSFVIRIDLFYQKNIIF